MFEQAIEMAISNGIWAVMFLSLLIYLLKDSSKREKKYMLLVDNLTHKYGLLKKIDKELSVVSANVLTIKTLCFVKKEAASAY